MKNSLEAAVRDRIAQENDAIAPLISSAVNTPSDRSKAISIRDFWPEIKVDFYNRTTNLPAGTNLFTRLPYGDRPIVDIGPLNDEAQFINRFGLSYKDLIPLIRERLVVPILYNPNPIKWKNDTVFRDSTLEDLVEIVKESYFHRGRNEAFCEHHDPEHKNVEKETKGVLSSFSNKGIVFRFAPSLQPSEFDDDAVQAVANRMAYLHTFNESNVYEAAKEKLADVVKGKLPLQEYTQFVHAQKWLICSDLTASLGGVFSISKLMAEQFILPSGQEVNLDKYEPVVSPEQSAALEWVTRRAANGSFDVNALRVNDAAALRVLVSDPEFRHKKESLNQEVENILSLLQTENVDRQGIETSAARIEEYARNLREEVSRIRANVGKAIERIDRAGKHMRYGGTSFGAIAAMQGVPIVPYVSGAVTVVGSVPGTAKYLADTFAPNWKIQVEAKFARRKLSSANKLRFFDFDEWLSQDRPRSW